MYDYIKLLYARIGRTFSPVSGREVRREDVSDVVDYIAGLPEGSAVEINALYKVPEGRTFAQAVAALAVQGYAG